MLTAAQIKKIAILSGFDLVGIARPREFSTNRDHYMEWLERGNAQTLSYMRNHLDIRFEPRALLEGCQTMVVCALNYKNHFSLEQRHSTLPKIASYALTRDYHKVIRRQLNNILRELQALEPSLRARCCVDSAPLLEKQAAIDAGLGWIGRQSLLITPSFGSFVLLGVMLLDQPVDQYDTPLGEDYNCGSCRACINSCPNGAICENSTIDSRRCISALTVESDNPSAAPLDGWVFGCDSCQSCCPHNINTPLASFAAIQPKFSPIDKARWQQLDREQFIALFGGSPIIRAGLERIRKTLEP